MDDVQLWRAAVDLLNSHGEGAQGQALKLADAALDGGDVESFNRWKRVSWLIGEMQAKKPGDDLH